MRSPNVSVFDADAEELASMLGELPTVASIADIDALPPDTVGVWACRLSDDLLVHLAGRLPRIRVLAGDGSSTVTDSGLVALEAFTLLEWLDLEWSPITDEGLGHVAAARTLRYVDLCGCSGVTREGIARLRAARPDLEVEAFDDDA